FSQTKERLVGSAILYLHASLQITFHCLVVAFYVWWIIYDLNCSGDCLIYCREYIFLVIERFEELESRNPGDTSIADLPNVQKLRKELCEAHSLSESMIPDALLERLLSSTTEFPPVCAIIGGILGQEVIKAISGKGDPLKNFFFFDSMDGKGIIEDISIVRAEG
ncbi:SUMO-activating enzyme subunit 1B-1-like, partial [Olea europaea var. sylvestris]|uniref:SUMO-activating enzyme subunit 1B-1-like n=1 Tax=Olea europaea var. sylvestris TaxID=158386 RepID=UPI000C1D028D